MPRLNIITSSTSSSHTPASLQRCSLAIHQHPACDAAHAGKGKDNHDKAAPQAST
jgi:hypothetical protein